MAIVHMGRALAATALAGPLLLITACGETPVEKATRRLDWVRDHGTKGERCAAERALQEAYFEAKDMENFSTQHLYADTACASAKLLGADTPANE
jgi:hypothetical protein